MSALPRESTPAPRRRLRLVEAEARAAVPPWRFVARGAVTALVLGAVSLLAAGLLTASR